MDVAVAGTACAQLSSFIGVPLLVKAVTPERTLGVISRVLTLAVYTLEGVRAGSTVCRSLSRRVGLGIGLAAPSHGSVVFHSVWATTFLTLSALSATGMGWMSPAPAVAALGNPRVHCSPPDCSCMSPKVKRAVNKGLALGPLLRVPNVNPNHRHV